MSDEASSALDPELFEMFRDETAMHVAALERDVVDLESNPAPATLESLMRAAHSIKGAARIIGLSQAVGLAHRMEDFFVAMQEGRAAADAAMVDLLLQATDFYKRLRTLELAKIEGWLCEQAVEIGRLEDELSTHASAAKPPEPTASAPEPAVDEDVNFDMMDLFKMELQIHLETLKSAPPLSQPVSPESCAELSRAAHSIKGAAKIVGLAGAARLAHAMEAFFDALAEGRIPSPASASPTLAETLAFFGEVESLASEQIPAYLSRRAADGDRLAAAWQSLLAADSTVAPVAAVAPVPPPPPPPAAPSPESKPTDHSLLVTTETLDRLTGLAGESWVQSRRLEKYVQRLFELRARHRAIETIVRSSSLARGTASPETIDDLRQLVAETSEDLTVAWRNIQQFGFEAEDLSERLYNAAIAARMRPLADGLKSFPRLVRDMARQLEKKIRFETVGASTQVDRDVLSQLDAPLTHALRNACDHGIESIPQRIAAGKPEQGVVRVEGSHRGGMLVVTVTDDGRGMDLDRIKAKVVQRNMAGPELVERMTHDELLEFVFLPGFSTSTQVSEFSGRGVGMDVVRTMLQRIGGTVRLRTTPGKGSSVEMQLPLSLALLRTLHVDVGGQAYAFPLARVHSVCRAPADALATVEGRLFLSRDGRQIPLLKLAETLSLPTHPHLDRDCPLVLCGEGDDLLAFAVDRIVEEKDMVVHPLDLRLGNVPAVGAGAIMEDGAIALILDVEDLLRLARNALLDAPAPAQEPDREERAARRVLVVDDSITVREVERRLLESHGCRVDLAVDGMDGWERARAARYDLIISDVDMPRMNGIDFVTRLKQDPLLKEIPVIIVSYKDKEEDRIRGLKAGANYYLTKSSFQDETLINAVRYLIGDL